LSAPWPSLADSKRCVWVGMVLAGICRVKLRESERQTRGERARLHASRKRGRLNVRERERARVVEREREKDKEKERERERESD